MHYSGPIRNCIYRISTDLLWLYSYIFSFYWTHVTYVPIFVNKSQDTRVHPTVVFRVCIQHINFKLNYSLIALWMFHKLSNLDWELLTREDNHQIGHFVSISTFVFINWPRFVFMDENFVTFSLNFYSATCILGLLLFTTWKQILIPKK